MDDEMKRPFGEGTVLSLRRLTCRVRGLLTNYHNVQPAKVNLNHERSAKRPETGQAVHHGLQPHARPRRPADRSTLGRCRSASRRYWPHSRASPGPRVLLDHVPSTGARRGFAIIPNGPSGSDYLAMGSESCFVSETRDNLAERAQRIATNVTARRRKPTTMKMSRPAGPAGLKPTGP
jgi:hypothetical protein